jgi:hypothetical protein
VDHKSQHTHLGGTSLVQLNGTLGKLGLLVERVPSKVEGVVAEVTNELSSGDVFHDGKLQGTNEKEDLKGSGNGDGGRGIPSVTKIRELGSVVRDISGKVDTGGVDQVSDNTKHTDTSVLDLDISETVELLLVTIGDKAKRIEEAKRILGTKFVLEGRKAGGGLSGLGGGKGGGAGDKGGNNGGFLVCTICESISSC